MKAIMRQIYVKDYERSYDTLALLEEEERVLTATAQFYGPLPCNYRSLSGGSEQDSLYMAAHERLSEIRAAIDALKERVWDASEQRYRPASEMRR